jgi:uncharacterized membrane protein HdeD (DUF308 family)
MNEEKKGRWKLTLRGVLTAAALFVFGLGLVAWSSYAVEIFTVIMGLYMVLSGFLRIRDAISVKAAGRKGTAVSVGVPVILALLEVACGVVCGLSCLILPGSVLTLAGVMLMAFGLAELVNAVFLAILRKKAEKQPDPKEPEAAPAQPAVQQDYYPEEFM